MTMRDLRFSRAAGTAVSRRYALAKSQERVEQLLNHSAIIDSKTGCNGSTRSVCYCETIGTAGTAVQNRSSIIKLEKRL
jgi:hypothetical protein